MESTTLHNTQTTRFLPTKINDEEWNNFERDRHVNSFYQNHILFDENPFYLSSLFSSSSNCDDGKEKRQHIPNIYSSSHHDKEEQKRSCKRFKR